MTSADDIDFRNAAKDGNVSQLEGLLKRGVNINSESKFGQRPLHMAALGGSLPAVELLVKKGAELNVVTRGGDTPIHLASKAGHAQVIEYLASIGIDVNIKNNAGQTASEGQEAAVKALFGYGADPEIADEQNKKAEDVANGDAIKALIVEQSKSSRRPPPEKAAMKGYPTTPTTTPVKTKLDEKSQVAPQPQPESAPNPAPMPTEQPQQQQPPGTPGSRTLRRDLSKVGSQANLGSTMNAVGAVKPPGMHAEPSRGMKPEHPPQSMSGPPMGFHGPPSTDPVTLLQQSLIEMQMMRAKMRELRAKVDFLTHNTIPKHLYLRFNDKTAVFKFDSIIDGTVFTGAPNHQGEPPHELSFR